MHFPYFPLTSTRKLGEKLAFLGGQLVHKVGITFEERLSIGQILQTFRTPARGVRSSAQFLVEKIDDPDDSQRYAVEQDLAGGPYRGSNRRIISELNWRTVGCSPVLGTLEGPAELESCCPQGGLRDRLASENRDVDVESRAGFLLMNLKSQASDDGVSDMLVGENATEREERRLLTLVHFSLKPVPLAIQ